MEIEKRYKLLKEEITSLAKSDCVLCAVSKQQPVESMLRLYRVGCRDFGENRAQELQEKRRFFEAQGINDIKWHFIGNIQSRQIPLILSCSDLIHSVNTKEILMKLELKAKSLGLRSKVLLQMNITKEFSKHGFTLEELESFISENMRLESLILSGLMTMAEMKASGQRLEETFGSLRGVLTSLQSKIVIGKELSMGMSLDYREALNQGSTIIRIGTALFKN